jgi:thiamine pyrophosphate-dependent acetolactate synthase large subunit-like protein
MAPSTTTATAASTGAGAETPSTGVEVCVANPGTTEMWLVGALDKTPAIRPVLGLHETVCTGAADGYGRMKRKAACTAGTGTTVPLPPE